MRLSVLALFVFFCPLPAATATLSPRKELGSLPSVSAARLTRAIPGQVVRSTPSSKSREQFQVTDETEIELDGRCCKYQEVPKNATILRIELAVDGRTIRKIHFRSQK